MELSRGDLLACRRRISIRARVSKGLACEDGRSLPRRSALVCKKTAFQVLEALYKDHPPSVWRVESRKAIKNLHEDSKSICLVYGEISFIAFARLLDICITMLRPSSGSFVFYDLGCGAGRAVFMTALLRNDCTKACGIEIIPGMNSMIQELLMLYRLEVLPLLGEPDGGQEISFIQGDFLKEDWSDADIVFANATCFGDPLFELLEARATSLMRNGSIFISVTKSFTGDAWELLRELEMKMSWSCARVYVQRMKHRLVDLA